MWRKRCCGCKSKFPLGSVLIAMGVGILLSYIIPYYILITLLGLALIATGIWCIRKK